MANVHYTPLHRNKYYNGLTTDEESPGAMEFFSRLLRLPIYPSLTNEEVQRGIMAVKKIFGK
jgi:dTDP-4-amino-4,6-dideoxygalactose transaminase